MPDILDCPLPVILAAWYLRRRRPLIELQIMPVRELCHVPLGLLLEREAAEKRKDKMGYIERRALLVILKHINGIYEANLRLLRLPSNAVFGVIPKRNEP